MTLAYNPSLLNVTGYSITGLGDPSDSSVTTFDTSTAGLVNITFTTSTGIVLGSGGSQVFLSLESNVPSTAGYQAKEILDLQNIHINAGSITALDDAAIHVSGFLGDATGDGIYTGLDAQRISRVAVGLDPGFWQWVLADPLIVGDVNGDNQLTGLDALQIARQAVGITQANIPLLTGVTPGIAGPDPVLSIPTDFAAKPQAMVQVPVNLDHSAGLASVDLAIAYDTSRLDVSSSADVQRGSLTSSFDSFTVNVDQAAGLIRISGYRSAGPVAGSENGSLAVINFQVRANAPAGSAIINLLQNAGNTWSLPGGTDARGNDFLFDLQPGVSNATGDPLDGVINVTPAKLSVPSPAVAADRVVVSPIIPEALAQSGDFVGDIPQHRIISPTVGGAYPPAADTANLAALIRLLVSSAMASYYTTAKPDVNANVVPRTGDGVPTTLLADDGRMTAPASFAADIFFSQYPAIVQNGIVGSGQDLLAEKDLAGLITAETAAFFFDDSGEDIPARLDDVRMP